MEMLFIVAILAVLAGPILAVIAIVQVSSVNDKLRQLKRELANLAEREPVTAAKAEPEAATTTPKKVLSKAAKVETQEL